MKNITLSADEDLIARAREQARARQTTINQLFRLWLEEVAEQKVDEACKKMLANQIMESYTFSLAKM